MSAFREYSDKYPFRHRSETPEIAVELSLQPWRKFGVDGVIMFSDILTPLPAMGVQFDVVKGKGPVIDNPIRTMEDVSAVRVLEDIDGRLPFVGHTLQVRALSPAGATCRGSCATRPILGNILGPCGQVGARALVHPAWGRSSCSLEPPVEQGRSAFPSPRTVGECAEPTPVERILCREADSARCPRNGVLSWY